MHITKLHLLFACIFLLVGCQKYYLSICQEKVDETSLASTYVGTPDPQQKNPPEGERLILEWQVPQEILRQHPYIELQVVYRNHEEETVVFSPISYRTGYVVHSLTGKKYEEKRGFLCYQAEIKTEEGIAFRSWKHQLWVKPIRVEETDVSPPEIEKSVDDEATSIEQDEESESATFFPPTS